MVVLSLQVSKEQACLLKCLHCMHTGVASTAAMVFGAPSEVVTAYNDCCYVV